MTYEPLLTTYTDAHPMPRTVIIFTGLAPGTTSVNVWRQADGRQMAVRGGAGLAVAGAFGLVDLEAPFGVLCLYFAEQFDSAGNFLGNTGTSQIALNCDQTWVHNPFNPAGGVQCRVGAGTGASVAGQIDVAVHYPTGRRAGIAVTGQRHGIPAVPVSLYGDTLEQSDALDAMFGAVNGDLGLPPFLCVRFAASMRIRLPKPLFLAVPAPTQKPVNLLAGGSLIGWDVSGAEVDPPAASLAQALLSRDDTDAAYATRDLKDATYATRLAMDTDYNLAGYSGSTDPGTTPGGGGGTGGGAIDNGDGTGTFTDATDSGDGTGLI